MIVESADIVVKKGMEAIFEAAVAQAAPLFRRARGCLSMQLQRGVEQAQAYRLIVQWEALEDHTVHFRASADFQEWRRLVGHCFETPPVVAHFEVRLAAVPAWRALPR
jgi:heme-degrading monooxygenase HmoA